MRHRKAHRNSAGSPTIASRCSATRPTRCIKYEHIETTVPRAKELRPFVERLITIAKRGVAAARATARCCTRGAGAAGPARSDGRRKTVRHDCARFAGRPGGYTRIIRLGYPPRRQRRGGATRARSAASSIRKRRRRKPRPRTPPKTKGVGDRLRAAADRLRGKKDEDDAESKKAARGGSTKGPDGKEHDAAEVRLGSVDRDHGRD